MLKNIVIPTDIPIREVLEIFETACLFDGLSEDTILWYRKTFSYFSSFYSLDSPIQTMDETLIQDYILHCLKVRQNKVSTVNNRLTAIKSFLNWCYEEHYIENPVRIRLIKDTVTVKETYTQDELERLLEKPSMKNCLFTTYRDWVITNFLLSTACRVKTLIHIKNQDVNLRDKEIFYTHMKNRKQMLIPLTEYMTKILYEYMAIRKGNMGDYLFCNRYSKQLTANALRISLNKYNLSKGVERTGRHIFRNTFAKLWILNGGDAFRLQKMLAHEDMTMTKRYIEMYSQDLKVNFEQYNPINSIVKPKKNYIQMTQRKRE